jgi:hypothetical protein
MSQLDNNFTTHFQGSDFSSHKPYSSHNGNLTTKSLQKIPPTFCEIDPNSPERTGLLNIAAARPEGSLDTTYYNSHSFSFSIDPFTILFKKYKTES